MERQKDNISAGLDALLGGGRDGAAERPQAQERGSNYGHGGKSAIKNRLATSLVIDRVKYDKVKQIAFDNSLNINEVIDVALDLVIETYEKKYGPITASGARVSASELIRSKKK